MSANTKEYGTYHTGFLITSLDMNLEKIHEYMQKASMYFAMLSKTKELLSSVNSEKDRQLVLEIANKKMASYKNAKEKVSTFTHEYIHYLQDITTTVGITCFTIYSNLIQEALHVIANDDAAEIQMPILTGKNNTINQLSFLKELFICANDKKQFKKLHNFDSVEIEEEILFQELHNINPCLFPMGISDLIHNIKIQVNNKTEEYDFGASIIGESMAYLFERLVFGANERINEYPYNICEMIVEKYCPLLKNKINILLAVCELSLMHCNSGEMFWNIIITINDYSLDFNSVDEFEKYFLEKTPHLFSWFEEMINSSDSAIDFLYPLSLSNTTNINKYLKGILRKGLVFRKKGLFISKAAEKKDCLNEISFWFYELGLPLLVDQNNDVYSREKLDLIEMLCPKALESFIYEHEKKCFLYRICEHQRMENPCFDETVCGEKPWTQINKTQMCPFATYLYHYLGDNIKIKKYCSHI